MYVSMVQVMVLRQIGVGLLPGPMLTYCYIETEEQIPMKFQWKYNDFLSTKCIWKCRQQNGSHLRLVPMC